MNLTVAVLGLPHTGKSLFCINFAEYLGARILCFHEEGPRGRGRGAVSPAEARRLMVDSSKRSNGIVRTFIVNLKLGAAAPLRLALVDTISLHEGDPLPRPKRAGLVLTLQHVQKADVVLYLADLSGSDPSSLAFNGTAGRLLENYCHRQAKNFRAVLAKEDLLGVEMDDAFFSWKRHLLAWKNNPVPVSSFNRVGFFELRQFLLLQQPAGK